MAPGNTAPQIFEKKKLSVRLPPKDLGKIPGRVIRSLEIFTVKNGKKLSARGPASLRLGLWRASCRKTVRNCRAAKNIHLRIQTQRP